MKFLVDKDFRAVGFGADEDRANAASNGSRGRGNCGWLVGGILFDNRGLLWR